METVYEPSNFSCTEKLDGLQDYFKEYAELCDFGSIKTTDCKDSNEGVFQHAALKLMGDGVKLNDLSHLSQLCSIDKLSVPDEALQREIHFTSKYTMRLKRDYGLSEEAKELETNKIKLLYMDNEPRKKEFDNIILLNRQSNNANDIEPGSEMLFSVRIYHPFDKDFYSRYDRMRCSHEIIVLGSQTLADLRDKILCANDTGYCIEAKGLTNDAEASDVKREYPSGLMCIGDVLYKDLRDPNAVDYTKVVRDWAREKRIGEFSRRNMNEVCIRDLRLRLGYPYLYEHRGDCEHIMVFADVRLISKFDSLSRRDYPQYYSVNRYNAQHCIFCRTSTAKWICINSDRLPQDKTFLCQECHESYNFIDGERIGDFKAYPYFDKSVVI